MALNLDFSVHDIESITFQRFQSGTSKWTKITGRTRDGETVEVTFFGGSHPSLSILEDFDRNKPDPEETPAED